MKRDPARPKAAHIPDEGFIRSVQRHGAGADAAWERKGYPTKVVREKFRKLRTRGFITSDNRVTQAGREFLALQESA